MGIEIDEPTREALVCDTLSIEKFASLASRRSARRPLTHESLMVINLCLHHHNGNMSVNETTYSGPSSVWRQFKCSGTILSSAMSMSTVLLARKSFP